MSVYLVEGSMGQGKGIFAAYRACQYYRKGLRVASNYPFDTYYLGQDSKNVIDCLPIIPTAESLLSLGYGSPDTDSHNGALFLDEGLLFLNSRNFASKGRTEFNQLFTQIRKLRWDVYIMVQGIDMIDSQVREHLIDYHVVVERLDRRRIPFITSLLELFFPSRYGLLAEKKSLLPHIVQAHTYLKRKEHRVKPQQTETLKPKRYYAMYDTYFRFSPNIPYNFLGHDYNLTVGDDYRLPQTTHAYTMLSGAYLRDAYKKYSPAPYYPDGKNLPSLNVGSSKSVFSIKSLISLITLVFLGYLLFYYFFPLFFGSDETEIDDIAAAPVVINGHTYTAAQVKQIQQIMKQSGDGDGVAVLPAAVPPPPPELSQTWRLTGYIHVPGSEPRYVIRDVSGNVRYVPSDVPYNAQYSEIIVDGERVTFYSGASGQNKTPDSLPVTGSLLSILPQGKEK